MARIIESTSYKNCNQNIILKKLNINNFNENLIKKYFKNLITNYYSIFYLILLINICNINLVNSRRIPQYSDGEIKEIILSENIFLKEKVPVFTKTHIICEFVNPVWYKNGELLNIELRRKESLKFDKIQKADAGVYSCFSGIKWSNVTLSVYPGGEIKPQTDSQSNSQANQTIIQSIQSIQSYSQITENSSIDEQHQQHNQYDEDLEDTTDHEDNLDLIDVNSQKLPNSAEKHNGSIPQFKSPISLLNIVPKPSGSYIKLACAANALPQPNITWTKDDKVIVRQMGKVNYKKWTISMEDAIPEDSGLYKCVVCNIHGCIEHVTKLIIKDRMRTRPLIRESFPKNVTALENSTAVFECAVYSDLAAHFQWIRYFNEEMNQSLVFEEIDLKSSEFINYKFFKKLKSDPDRSDILRIENITHEDEGWYTCIAANSLGKTVSSAYLRVIDEEDVLEQPVSLPIRNHSLYMTVFKVSVGVLFLLGAIFILTIVRKMKHDKLKKHRMETVHQWTKKVIIYHPSNDPSNPETIIMPIIKIEKQRTTLLQTSNCDPSPFNEYEFPLDSDWEIPRNQLILGSTLGEGAFGRVVMAEATGLARSPKQSIVAVKMVKEGHTDSDMASLVHEMEVMKMIGKHINIINLLGCCTQDGPLYVIVEYAPHGNLKDFLRKNSPKYLDSTAKLFIDEPDRKCLIQKDLISFAYQIARGMEYLASRRCIHRDLAARNVLVSDDYIMKIADFGLARDIQETEYYRRQSHGRLPIKWMAPESFKDKFYDSQSDVWSYGILLWEIMTYGESPYPNIMSSDELYNFLMSGHRLEKPVSCSLNIYMLMRQCWNFDAHARPTFSEIVENLDKILAATANANEEYLDLGIPMLETPPSSSDEESDAETLQETSFMRYHY